MNKVIISLDFELGWGGLQERSWEQRQKTGVYKRLRDDMALVLARADELDIPMTFASVGAMLQSEEEYQFSHLPIGYRNAVDYFVTHAERETVDGRDLMGMVLASRVSHEIASHTYSHLHAQHQEATDEALRADLLLSLDVLKKWGIDATSLVFPRDQEFSGSVLSGSGIEMVRVPPRFGRFAKLSRAITLPKSTSAKAGWGGVEQSGSMLLNWSTGKKAGLKKALISSKSRQTLNNKNGAYHFWLHPFNWSDTPGFAEWFLGYLELLATRRDQFSVELVTMKASVHELLTSAAQNP